MAVGKGIGFVDSRVGAGVGHGKKSGADVLSLEVLIGEFLSVDGFATGPLEVRTSVTIEKRLR